MQEFKDIDYNNKNNSKILKMLKRLRIEVENVKLELTRENHASFFLDSFYNGEDLKLIIERETYENLCMDLWEKCIKKLEKHLN